MFVSEGCGFARVGKRARAGLNEEKDHDCRSGCEFARVGRRTQAGIGIV